MYEIKETLGQKIANYILIASVIILSLMFFYDVHVIALSLSKISNFYEFTG